MGYFVVDSDTVSQMTLLCKFLLRDLAELTNGTLKVNL